MFSLVFWGFMFRGSDLGLVHRWEFPKIGDPNLVPKIVGSLL